MEQSNSNAKMNIESLLLQGKSVCFPLEGYSMYPLFVPQRDKAIVVPAKNQKIKKNDVILYRRDGDILVLHRVCKCHKDGYFLVGDNQIEVEGPIRIDQVRGIMKGGIRGGKEFSVDNPSYRLVTFVWLHLRPVRTPIKRTAAFIKHLFKK